MIEFPDSPATGDLHAAGGASWRWDGVKWTADTSGPLLAQGEVLGNPDPADAEAIPADLAVMLRAALGDGAAGQALLAGGPAVDPAWGSLPTAPTPPILHQGEVLGNPSATDGGAVPADLPLMLRSAIGDGVAGQALLAGGPAVDPAWGSLPTPPVLHQGDVLGNPSAPDGGAVAASLETMLRAALGDGVAGQALLAGGPAADPAWGSLPTVPKPLNFIFNIEQAMTNGEETHRFIPPACSFPAGAAGSSGTAGTAATASTTNTVKKNGTGFATFVWAGAGTSATVTLPSTTVFNGTTDVLTMEGPATADATLAKIGINLAGSRT